METPSSSKKLARSAVGKKPESSALSDITNSPIVGLAEGILRTPSSAAGKIAARAAARKTPCSGENILRCQVKTLLQKVNNEGETQERVIKRSYLALLSHLRSSGSVLAPTPANSPQTDSFSSRVAEGLDEEESINRVLQFEQDDDGDDDDHDNYGDSIENICWGMKRLSAGKHTRFIYDSDEEIVGEEEVVESPPEKESLRGLPAATGKHLRFRAEDEEEDGSK